MAYRKWKPSKAKAEAFKKTMSDIDKFLDKHPDISRSFNGDSYYFQIGEQYYRVSNHSVEASNRGAYRDGVQVRELYHENGREADTIYIHASKTRIIEIYNNLVAGIMVDGHGNPIFD